MSKPLSLEAYAAKNPPRHGTVCWVCQLPERPELDKAFGGKVTASVIQSWLVTEKGYSPKEASLAKLHYHFGKMGHHKNA